MMHYVIKKDNTKKYLNKDFKLHDGCLFRSKNNIIIYDKDMIDYVVQKKLTNLLGQILLLYRLYSATESGDDQNKLQIKIEYYRELLLKDYFNHLSKEKLKNYENKITKLENSLNMKKVRGKQY